jgi:hypothetical protein
MAKQLAALLGGGLDLKALAEMLRRQGRGQDTILAHITPQEAALLKSRGGAGTMNPATGLPEFQQDDYGDDYSGVDLGVYSQPVSQPSIQSSDIMPTPETGGEPVTPTYGTVAQRYEAPVQVPEPNFQQASSPYFMGEQILPPFRPSLVYGDGMTGAATETYDRGVEAQAPGRSFEDMLKTGAKQVLGTREGLAGLGTAAALFQARQAGQQARRMQQELSQIGAPNRALGQEMIARGQRGELTPVQQQQMAALDARQKQQLSDRRITSGTAQQQQQARMQEMQQRGAQDLIDQGIKIAGIGDQYQAAAVRAGYAADQATRDMLNTTLTNLYRTIYGNVATPETTSKTPPPRG